MSFGEEVRRTTPRFVQTTLKGVNQVLINSLKSRRDDERGFTLIELMVVVLIIAILIAIAIPTFLGARKRAQDRAAQSDLRNGLTAEKTFYTDAESYAPSTDTELTQNIESSLNWGTDLKVTLADVTAGDKNVVCLEQKSKSGKNFALADVATGSTAGTYYKSDASGAAICTGVTAAGFTAANNWVKSGW
jgi:type IV pilus assembly protein PilA